MKLNAVGVGLRIRQARAAKGWTQAELAKAVGVRRSSVVRWETGISVPSRLGIPKLAKILGQPADWLLAKADEVSAVKDNGIEETRELKKLRGEIRRLRERMKGEADRLEAEPAREEYKDQAVLDDIMSGWNRVNSESRLLAALLITGDWSYKLKLWNRDVAVDQEVLRAIGLAHRKTRGA